MIVRAIDSSDDWTFGKGRNNYQVDLYAVAQNLATRLRSFLGDCFFDSAAGIDWFNLLGAKDPVALNLSLKAVILNTRNVTRLLELNIVIDSDRQIFISYAVQCVFPGTIRRGIGVLLDENGDFIITESGDRISA